MVRKGLIVRIEKKRKIDSMKRFDIFLQVTINPFLPIHEKYRLLHQLLHFTRFLCVFFTLMFGHNFFILKKNLVNAVRDESCREKIASISPKVQSLWRKQIFV